MKTVITQENESNSRKETSREPVMFGMMLSKGNYDQAEKTAMAFAQEAKKGDMIGIQTNDLSRDHKDPAVQKLLVDFIDRRVAEPWEKVFLWDSRVEDTWKSTWKGSLPEPFYVGDNTFSYGGAVNRLLVLTIVAEVPVLVRVDAGTAPMVSPPFGASLHKHLALLDKHAVISGIYHGRIALRDDWLPARDRSAFHALVQQRMAINPLNQITGGACFALRVKNGPPAIAFPGFLPVWGSDDAFFQSIEPRSRVNDEMIVERSAPGQPLKEPEYTTRLACSAALAAIHHQANFLLRFVPALDEVVAAGKSFLDQFRNSFPDSVRVSAHEGAIRRLKDRALGLIEGYENYSELKHCWADVCDHVTAVASTLRPHCQCK